VHLIFFSNSSYFESYGIKTIDDPGKTNPLIEWTKEVRKQDQNKGFILYVNNIMSAFYILLHGTHPPRMFPEFKRIL
jgi:hypothetical protein